MSDNREHSAASAGRAEDGASPADLRRWARTGMLAAFALVLSYVETFVPLPIPVPGAKLGLANIAVLMAFYLVGGRGALAVAVIKTLVTGFLFGSPLMLPYSAAGTLLAFGGMALLVRVPGLSPVFASMFGGVLHCAGQLAVASALLGTALVWYSFPVLMVVALATGALTGKLAVALLAAEPAEEAFAPAGAPALPVLAADSRGAERPDALLGRVAPGALLGGLAVYMLVVFCAQSAVSLGACALVAALAALLARVRPRAVAAALGPLASVLVITAVAQVAYGQQGTPVAVVGPVTVTAEALTAAGAMFVRLLCLLTASAAVMAVVDGAALVGALRRGAERVRWRGRGPEAFLVALDLALSFVPVLTGIFHDLRRERAAADPGFADAGPWGRVRGHAALLAPLAAQALAHADAEAARMAAEGAPSASQA